MAVLRNRNLISIMLVGVLCAMGVQEETRAETGYRSRDEIPARYKWDLTPIFENWEAWEEALKTFEQKVDTLASMKGTLAQGPDQLLKVYQLRDEIGKLAYLIYRYPALQFDLNQKDTDVRAKTQRVAALFEKQSKAEAWFAPELLSIPLETVRKWMDENPELATYRFAIENLYRLQAHVLDEKGEMLLAYHERFDQSPADIFSALSTADITFPTITLSSGEEVLVTPGMYQTILLTNRNQADRATAFHAYYQPYKSHINTYAAIYNAVLQRDWANAQARNYSSTLEASLYANNIPVSVVENLIATTRAGVEPLQRYNRLRKQVLGLKDYHLYDSSLPLVDLDKHYDYDDAVKWVIASVEPFGKAYGKMIRKAFSGGWVDVYETEGKRSGAYSAGTYGVHPYMLINYHGTLNDVFTLAHEMGHTMHTILAQENQPFIYSEPTLFVAEVASTMNEALLLEYMLDKSKDPKERILLLQTAIDNIKNTFYGQVMFAAYELEAHRRVERGEPVTSETLSDLYYGLLKEFFGDSMTLDDTYRFSWSRIPHFFRSPYYVYQYATCFASSAMLFNAITDPHASRKARRQAVERYLTLLKSGSSDYPMELLKRAGVDLSKPETVQAVIDEMADLVDRLEQEIARL